jgi:hypothetical protein
MAMAIVEPHVGAIRRAGCIATVTVREVIVYDHVD